MTPSPDKAVERLAELEKLWWDLRKELDAANAQLAAVNQRIAPTDRRKAVSDKLDLDALERAKVEITPETFESYMKKWDAVRRSVAAGSRGSAPRDAVESWLGAKDETIAELIDLAEALARQRDALLEAAKAVAQGSTSHLVGAGDGDTFYVTTPPTSALNALRAAIRACEGE